MDTFVNKGGLPDAVSRMIKKERDGHIWFAMTSPDPKTVEEYLLRENDKRKSEGRDTFLFFIPYQFLEKRIVDEGAFDEEDIDDPRSEASIRENNVLRTALKRYIFIKSEERELQGLLTAKETKEYFSTLWWLRDKDKNRITVPDSEMEQFINACCDIHLKFEVCPAVRELKENEKVKLNIDGFRGREAWILDVKHVHDRTELVCGFYIFYETAMIKIRHLSPEDVIIPQDKSATAREQNNYKVLEDIQRKVFLLLEHYIHPLGLPDAVRRKDAVTLEKLNGYRYRKFDTLSLQAKHCALMLLCTLLSHDTYAGKQFTNKAESLLEEINRKPENKAPKDVAAYLHSALYMATGNLSYYEKAKKYYLSLPKQTGTQVQLGIFMDAICDKK